MTQYLVTLCGTMDDLPVALFSSKHARELAQQFTDNHHPFPVDGAGCETEGPLSEAAKVNGCGPSCVFGWKVFKFVDGRPVATYRVKWFDGEWPTREELENWEGGKTTFFAELKSDIIG